MSDPGVYHRVGKAEALSATSNTEFDANSAWDAAACVGLALVLKWWFFGESASEIVGCITCAISITGLLVLPRLITQHGVSAPRSVDLWALHGLGSIVMLGLVAVLDFLGPSFGFAMLVMILVTGAVIVLQAIIGILAFVRIFRTSVLVERGYDRLATIYAAGHLFFLANFLANWS